MKYICSRCRQVYERDSDKAWIKSYCTKMDMEAKLIKEKLMQLTQFEQEAIVIEQLEWLLNYELKEAGDRDDELVNALVRVLLEFKVTK